MPDISIKNVPKRELESIRAQAKRNHRSLQGELRIILSEAAERSAGRGTLGGKSFDKAVAELKQIALKTPSESVRMIREDRNGR
ncbi:MAG TPA: hypothetical protein VFY21_15125 [Xanthobacteraceae bacterium]|nr:hypothetical protein [Xanthobacteraceae bacterium]